MLVAQVSADELVKHCVRQWTKQATALANLLESHIDAGFEVRKDNLMTDDVACATYLKNKESYKRIGPLCGDAKEFTKLMKAVQADGHGAVFDPALHDKLFKLFNVGIEYVCYVYAVFYIRTELCTLAKGSEKVLKTVEAIRTKFRDHKVTMSTQLSGILNDLENSETAPLAYKLPDQVEVPAAPAPPAAAPVVEAPPAGSAPPAAAPVEAAGAPTGSAPAVPAPMPKRRRLAERVQARAPR